MIVAGLTGGIATGKSTVAAIFEAAGARLIDADRIARDAVRKGAPAYHDTVAHFGEAVLQGDGEIDRKRLAAVIFNDPAEQQIARAHRPPAGQTGNHPTPGPDPAGDAGCPGHRRRAAAV